MPDLSFQVEGVEVVANAATPLLAFKLRLTDANPEQTIHTVALRCQIQLEVTRRKYTPEDQERLLDLFGEPSRWGQTLRNLLWTHANLVVPSFTGNTLVDLPVPCTFDFNVAATKYFDGLADGEVPVCLQFSGTVFYANGEGGLAGRAHFVGQGSPLQTAGESLARHDGVVLSQQRLALPAQGCLRPLVPIQSPARHSHLGRGAGEHHSGENEEAKRGGDLMNLASGGPDREGGAVRGIHALSLPPIVGEKSAALEFRRALPAVLQRGAEGQRSLDHADRMPGRRQFADCA